MSDLTFYVLKMVDGSEYILDQQEGDKLSAKLLERRNGDQSPLFISAEDVSGSDLVFQAQDASILILSTPQTRENDEKGVLHEIQKILNTEDWEKD
jgi:hypothetical protein